VPKSFLLSFDIQGYRHLSPLGNVKDDARNMREMVVTCFQAECWLIMKHRPKFLCSETKGLLTGVDLVNDVVTAVISPVTASLSHDGRDLALGNITRTLLVNIIRRISGSPTWARK
jgi:hypothetical protein